jgi:hypothetical protein
MWEDHRLRVFENRVLRWIFGSKRNVVTGDWRKLRNGASLGVKRPGRGVDHPPPPSDEFKQRVELNLYSPSGPSWPVLG